MIFLNYILSFIFLIEIVFHSSDFKQTIEEYIYRKLNYKKENLVFEYLNVPEKIVVQSSNAKLIVSDVSSNLLKGNVTIPINVVSENKVLKRVFISLKIRVFDTVFVSKKPINQFQNFTYENVEKKRIEITGYEEPVKKETEIIGMRANRYITEGKVITANLIENVPIIKNGQQIQIISRVNSVVIKALGVAKEDGRKGEIITVENTSSGAKLKAKVIDEENVEIIRWGYYV